MGTTWDEIERAQGKGSRQCNVTPALVKNWIETEVLKRTGPTEEAAQVLKPVKKEGARPRLES